MYRSKLGQYKTNFIQYKSNIGQYKIMMRLDSTCLFFQQIKLNWRHVQVEIGTVQDDFWTVLVEIGTVQDTNSTNLGEILGQYKVISSSFTR
jgi:hypothetical protein